MQRNPLTSSSLTAMRNKNNERKRKRIKDVMQSCNRCVIIGQRLSISISDRSLGESPKSYETFIISIKSKNLSQNERNYHNFDFTWVPLNVSALSPSGDHSFYINLFKNSFNSTLLSKVFEISKNLCSNYEL